MTTIDDGRSASRRNSIVSLGLVGVPSLSEPAQTADAFEFDIDPVIDYSVELDADFLAQIDALCANPSLPDGQSLNDLQTATDLASQTNLKAAELSQHCAPNEQYDPYTYDPTNLSSFPVQQNLGYPEPQGYYSAYEAPYFDNGYGTLAPPEDTFDTLGFTAIPGNNALTGYEDIQYPPQQFGFLPEPWTLPVEVGSLPTVNAGYVPVETAMQYATYPSDHPRAATTSQAFTIGPVPFSVTNQHKDKEPPVSDSDSDEDYRNTETKTTKVSKREKRKQRRKYSLSSACTSAATPSSPVKYVPGEKPKKVDAKPWIRTNANTEGDTRTAKINNWKNKYEYKPLPLGPWTSGKHTFKYTQYENVDFLTEAPMSTRKIKEYIMNYPCDDQKRLVLWIQKMPADQGRRYGSKQHSKCAFKYCPIQRYVEGTISTGEYRVAFDEKHFTYGDKVDPYDCTAYAHLYCVEQFLDFEQVCQVADVRVDTRIDLPLEPNGKAAFSMVDVPARAEMERFIKLASKGKLRMTERWHNYPFHGDYQRDQQKPHEYTLTYLAHCMYEAHQDDSHKKQAALRRVTVSQRRVHLGDLEMAVADKRIIVDIFKRKKKGRNDKVEDHYDNRIRYHIARAEQEARDFLADKKQGGKKRKAQEARSKNCKKGKKGKAVEDERTEDQETACSAGPRETRQKKRKVNYAESPVEQRHQYDEVAYLQHQPVQPVQAPEQQVQQLQIYLATNVSYAPEPPLSDPTLDTPYGLYAVPATPKLNIEDFSNFPTCEDDLPDDNLEKLLALERRQSCAADFGPMSILKSAEVVNGRTPRRAVFGVQPVTSSKEYGVNDPPNAMFVRRSGRIRNRALLSR